MTEDGLSNELRVIRDNFVVSLTERRNQLETAMNSWQNSLFPNQDPAMQQLYSLSHQLTGTAGSVGFPEISDAAREMNTRLRLLLHSDQQSIDETQLSVIRACFAQLQSEINKPLVDTA